VATPVVKYVSTPRFGSEGTSFLLRYCVLRGSKTLLHNSKLTLNMINDSVGRLIFVDGRAQMSLWSAIDVDRDPFLATWRIPSRAGLASMAWSGFQGV
ncbi:MAG: hypothetical protein AAFZ74_19295, partial [Pseudomonadota bacterium]